MENCSSLSDELYKELERNSGAERPQSRATHGLQQNSRPRNHEGLGAKPNTSEIGVNNGNRNHNFTSLKGRCSSQENVRATQTRSFQKMNLHQRYVNHNSVGRGHESSFRNFKKQNPSNVNGQKSDFDNREFDSALLKSVKKSNENEDIPGFRYTQIKKLIEKNPDDLLVHLVTKMDYFCSLLNQNLRPDVVMLVVEMLAKITNVEMKENQAAVLACAIQPNVLNMFSLHAFDIVTKDVKYNHAELIYYFSNICTIYEDTMVIMPFSATDVLQEHSRKAHMALQSLKSIKKVEVPRELDERYDLLVASVESLAEQYKSAPRNRKNVKVFSEWKPGIDFRNLSIHPLPQDLLTQPEGNICPAVVNGPYKSVEHYLDVQFNLMREDFLIPLREGIADFIDQRSSKTSKLKRIENVRFYREVRFLNQCVEGDTLITDVLFDPRGKLRRVNWKRSKRFLYGSLLCFTSNTFKSLFLGIVLDRKVELLEKGILRCELIGEVKEGELFIREFIMAENEVYFEAYQHVLRALQSFNKNNFPLEEYIINVTRDLLIPNYIAINPLAIYEHEGVEFPVLNENQWPTLTQLKVNESQFNALYSALTKKCAVIQGPPGTGKTYLGLIIAKILLQNADHWRRGKEQPILVVCFTNHALDQFLEGMLSFTTNIIRMGGQSKNEKLDAYNLKKVRWKKGMKDFALFNIEEKMGETARHINHASGLIKEFTKNTGILGLNYLIDVLDNCHCLWFKNNGQLNNSLLVEWLLIGAFYHNVNTDLITDDIEPIGERMEDVYACSLQTIMGYINQLKQDALSSDVYDRDGVSNIINIYTKRFYYLQKKLSEPFQENQELIDKIRSFRNLNSLHPEDRWNLYKYWVSKATEDHQDILLKEMSVYQALKKQKSEILEYLHLEAVAECDVLGMTTTGAAKHQSLLQKLGSKIVIVEEAAEAMESHVVVSLSAECEHLILIGDHKQLRPSPAVYTLATDYNLNISLFERLLMNGVSFDTLNIQHRMGPDIADLVFPAVYPVLENHPSVEQYDSVVGLKKNLYFITHTNTEETAMDDISKKNTHEAEFLIALCKHIVLQGYDPSQITILTMYLGQMFCLMEEKDKHAIIRGVRVAVVDNFQGEENDIILLSLVRNNNEKQIGFLANENRTCVSLSRAKKGLFVIGNIYHLAENSSLWEKIRKVLEDKEAVGTHLTLQCFKHPGQLTEVSKAEDFVRVIEGGCTLMCEEEMNCGHICKKICHAKNHENYICKEICNKQMCIRNHRCQKECWEDCGECMVIVESCLRCGHKARIKCHVEPSEYKCQELVSVKLPDCEHTNEKLCHVNIRNVHCSFACDSRLPCGHMCEFKCHVNHDPDHLDYKCMRPCSRTNLECKERHICQRKCYEECSLCTFKVKRKLPNCDHFHSMECSLDPGTIECRKKCNKNLPCGHICPKKCFEECGGCPVIVVKEIPDCKHRRKMKCCETPARSMCQEKCERIRPCGHTCSGICGFPCMKNNCTFLSHRSARAFCGHEVRLFCCELSNVPDSKTLMKRCKEACNAVLECSHRCKGTCGQCMQGRIHIPCQQKCGRNLICGHECNVSCSETCPPCQKKCEIRCEHSKCKEKCGKPCAPCQEICGWKCEHFKCGKKCSEPCDRPPCAEPCKKKLKCGHQCLGFCGEGCPDICKICDPDKVEDILLFFGTDDDENARFVVLPDCGHVFDSAGLDKWFSMNTEVVKLLSCPQCKRPVQKALRYGNAAKADFNNVLKVKQKVFGNIGKTSHRLKTYTDKLGCLCRYKEFEKSRKQLENLQWQITESKKRRFSIAHLNSLENRSQFVLAIYEYFTELRIVISQLQLVGCTKTANKLIKVILNRLEMLTSQEHNDFDRECKRFHLIMLLRSIENTDGFKTYAKTSWYKDYEECRAIVESLKAFEKGKYKETLGKLNNVYRILTSSAIAVSVKEMKEIVVALNLHQGHWCTCPNGHVYAIGECGGAVAVGRCNECGEQIGGLSHRLMSTNRRLQNVPSGIE